MPTPFLGEIKMVSFNFAPQGYAFCNGQLLPINQNQALFSLMGTMYGGDGRVNFGLPDLRGRVPLHVGNGHTQGETGGASSHTLSISQLPAHTHTLMGSSAASANTPSATTVLGKSAPQAVYGGAANLVAMDAASIGNAGGSQAHTNLQPYLVLGFVVALQGIFPSQD